MGEIAFGIVSGLIVGYVVYNRVKSYKKYRNYQEFKDDEEKSIYELIDILKNEMKNYPEETSLNIKERNRLITHIINIQKETISINPIYYFKLIHIIRYLQNPSKCINYENSKIKKEIDYIFK